MDRTHAILAFAALLGLSAVQARAESEGEPFPFHAPDRNVTGSPFLVETASEHYPEAGRTSAEASSFALLAPGAGSEAALQSMASGPPNFTRGTVADHQARSLDRFQARKGGVPAITADALPRRF